MSGSVRAAASRIAADRPCPSRRPTGGAPSAAPSSRAGAPIQKTNAEQVGAVELLADREQADDRRGDADQADARRDLLQRRDGRRQPEIGRPRSSIMLAAGSLAVLGAPARRAPGLGSAAAAAVGRRRSNVVADARAG